MFASKKSSLNEWKNWAIGLVGNTISSIDQATSRWFWNLINGLPRDYFAKTFDQVNYLDKRVWEGMFRASIEEIKEQLELGVSGSIVEANLVKLQGLIGKYSLSPVIYENGLEELEDFISNLSNAGNYLKVLKEIRNEFREELKSQPALLKECIEGEANLGRKESEYYKSLLDDRSLKNTSPERVISESPILDKAAVSKRGNSNSKLRNISKLLFSNPGQALTLFLAAQSAFASAANIQMSNSTGLAIGNDTLSFDKNLFALFQLRGGINASLSMQINSSEDLSSKLVEVSGGKVRELKNFDKLVWDLTYAEKSKSQDAERYKRSPESDSSDGFSSLSDSDEVEDLKIRVKKFQEDLESMKEYSSVSHANFTETISLLERKNEKLQKDIENSRRSDTQTINKLQNDKESFLGRIDELQRNITELNNQLIKERRGFLPYACINDIESLRFNPAEEKLKEMNNNETKEVINRVYNNNAEGRFSLLLGFGKNLRSIPLTLSVYTSLDNEMRKANNGNNDIFKAIDLAKAVLSIKSKVINQRNAPLELREKANNILNSLKGSIKNMAVKELSDAMKNKTYDKGDRNVFKISKAVSSLNQELFRDFITNVIDDVYDQVDTGSVILDFIYKSQCTERIHGYKAILKKMKDKNHLDFRSAATELGRCIKDLMNGVVCSLSPGEKLVVRGLKNEFPDYLQVAIFAEKVCIKNVEYNEYLYAAIDYFNHDSDRRTVFTWVPRNKVNNGYWILSSDQRGYFSIKNTQHGEYLFVSQAKFDAEEMMCINDIRSEWHNTIRGPFLICVDDPHKVFTWVPKSKDNDADWEFLLDASRPHTMRIRNVYHTRFLYASYSHYDDNRRRVYAANDVNIGKDLWEIEDCSNMRRRRDVQSYSEPSSYLSDIALEKTKESNSSFISR